MPEKTDITRLLNKAQAGDKNALDELLPLVYNELRSVAGNQLKTERDNHTLQATALVHEAYLRLLDQHTVDWRNRAHFFGLAAQMMRRILVNYAVERKAQKRGSGATRIALDDAVSYTDEREMDLVLLDENLKRLTEFDEMQAKIVELRFFGGLTIEETAEVLGISPSTVTREWRMAKSWLMAQF
ncbi:MAG TPA: sigma-70 family RNA polymerase sigma factor [Pyrinomonadaceae bacterium]|nr:sigma-70 family RNA polymerase sigma factor [Pyrinomonadaceae bacterium]